MRRLAPVWANILVAICLTALCLGLAGQFGRWSDRADLINFGAPIWGAAGGGAALILLATAARAYQRILAAVVIAALGLLMFSLFSPALRAGSAADCPLFPLRVIQFNIFKNNAQLQPALAWIKGSGADLVLLEEATGKPSIVEQLRPSFPYAVACVRDLRCSTVILSRRPFTASGGLARGDPENRKGLSAAWATIASPAGPFTVVAAHLSRPWPWRSNPGERDELADFVRRQGSDTTLVAGDFNLPPHTFQLRKLAAAFGLRVAPNIRSWPATATWPALWAIDHFFLGTRWTVNHVRRGPLLGSDHYPLQAELRLSGKCSTRT